MSNKCISCGSQMKERLERVKYDEGGLDVTLVDMPVLTCPKCGEREVGIPAVEGLHKLLSTMIATKAARLTPAEIRFLRKYLGLSSVDLGRKISVHKTTISRWENGHEPMGEQSEKLLRVMALRDKPVSEYPLEEMASEEQAPLHLTLVHAKGGWQPRAA